MPVRLEVPLPGPALPAAVEVAAYRIACEALTNVVRHAHAASCRVHLALDREEAVRMVDTLEPNIVLMDILMPVLSGIPATRRIGIPDPRQSEIGAVSRKSFLSMTSTREAVAARRRPRCACC